MAQFLTFKGHVVAEQAGHGNVIKVRYRGRKDFIAVNAAEWLAGKQFHYFDPSKVPRATVLDLYEAAQKQKSA